MLSGEGLCHPGDGGGSLAAGSCPPLGAAAPRPTSPATFRAFLGPRWFRTWRRQSAGGRSLPTLPQSPLSPCPRCFSPPDFAPGNRPRFGGKKIRGRRNYKNRRPPGQLWAVLIGNL